MTPADRAYLHLENAQAGYQLLGSRPDLLAASTGVALEAVLRALDQGNVMTLQLMATVAVHALTGPRPLPQPSAPGRN